MELGVSSYAFGWAVGVAGRVPAAPFDELDLVVYAREHGLRVIQIGDHIPLHTYSSDRLERLRVASSEENITLEIGGRGLTASHLSDYIRVAAALRATLLRFVIDGADYEPAPTEIITLIRDVVRTLEATELTLGIENHDRLDAVSLRHIMETVGHSRVGICLDTANSLGAGEGLEWVVSQLGPHTVNVHLKDFAIRRMSHAMGFLIEGRPAGAGMLDVPKLRDRLDRFGRCRTAILETWGPAEASLDAAIATERKWADQSLAYLKPLFPET